MKRCLILLCAAMLLGGCTRAVPPETEPTGTVITQPPETAPVDTRPTETIPVETAPPQTQPLETEPADTGAYTLSLHAAVPIFAGPSYDEACLRIVGEDGVYTIVEEVTDAEGNTWGRLKSGAGWVDLTALDDAAPVTAAFADDALLQSGNYHTYMTEESEYITLIAFRAREPLTGVQLSLLGDDYTVQEPLWTIPALIPGTPLVAGVVFYGDLTAYGLSFTDAEGVIRHYAVTISGRNGALVMEEYVP